MLNKRSGWGFSLVEFMITTLLIGLLLNLMLLLYSSNKKTYQYTQAIANIDENSLFVDNLLRNEIHEAGYIGCINLRNTTLNILIDGIPFNSDYALHGFHGSDVINSDSKIIPDSDSLLIQSVTDSQELAIPAKTQDHIILPLTFAVKLDQALLISDCQHAEIFFVTRIEKAGNTFSVTISPNLRFHYDNMAQVGVLTANEYYVANSGRKDAQGMPMYSLYQKNLFDSSHRQDELLEGVVDMRIEYDVIDTNGKLKTFTTEQMNTLQRWRDIRAVRIALLFASINPILTKPQTYSFLNTLHLAHDLKYYAPWSIYSTLRERVADGIP